MSPQCMHSQGEDLVGCTLDCLSAFLLLSFFFGLITKFVVITTTKCQSFAVHNHTADRRSLIPRVLASVPGSEPS